MLSLLGVASQGLRGFSEKSRRQSKVLAGTCLPVWQQPFIYQVSFPSTQSPSPNLERHGPP